MSVDDESGNAVGDEEDRTESLKQQKAKDKMAFTKNKNNLLSLLDEEDYLRRWEVKAACQMLCEVQVNQLKRVSIPIFNGNERMYEG